MRFTAFSFALAGIAAATLMVSGSALAVTFIPRDVPGTAQEVEPIGLQSTPPAADRTSAPAAIDPTPSAVPLPEVEELTVDAVPESPDGNSGIGIGNGGGNGTGNEGNGSTGTHGTGSSSSNGTGQGNNGTGQGNGGGNGTGNEGNGTGPKE
ncbi:hypothetical protein BH09ACT3_BH09ACT3_07620 [soil metagenome]